MRSSDLAELSTLQAQLEDLTARVVAVAQRYDETAASAVASDLYTAERMLLGAGRSVRHALTQLGDAGATP